MWYVIWELTLIVKTEIKEPKFTSTPAIRTRRNILEAAVNENTTPQKFTVIQESLTLWRDTTTFICVPDTMGSWHWARHLGLDSLWTPCLWERPGSPCLWGWPWSPCLWGWGYSLTLGIEKEAFAWRSEDPLQEKTRVVLTATSSQNLLAQNRGGWEGRCRIWGSMFRT